MGVASGLNSKRIRHALPVPIYLHEKIQELEKTLGTSKRDSNVEDGRLSYLLPLEMHKRDTNSYPAPTTLITRPLLISAGLRSS